MPSGPSPIPSRGARYHAKARLWAGQAAHRYGVDTQPPPYRDPAVILIDQLKEIYIDGVLEPVDTTQWYPRIMRKDYTVGLNVTESAVDDPDQQFYENYVCGSERNYTGYCNPAVDKQVDQQSMESDRKSASNWSGKSSGNWQRTAPGPSSFILVAQLAAGEGNDRNDQQHLQRLPV
jgi:ABC-type transport system substrate-binding protein